MNWQLITLLGGLLTATIPVLWPLRDAESRRLNGHGVMFIVAALISLTAGGYVNFQSQLDQIASNSRLTDILNRVERQILQITENDFNLLVESSIRLVNIGKGEVPDSIYLHGSLGEFSFNCEARYEGKSYLPGGKGIAGWIILKHRCTTLRIHGLNEYSYIGDLIGKRFTITLPMEELRCTSGEWKHAISLQVKGRYFDEEASLDGKIDFVFKEQLLPKLPKGQPNG